MKGNDLHLYMRDPHGTIGRLIFKDLMTGQPGRTKGIQIEMEFVPWSNSPGGGARWLALAATIGNQRTDEPRTFGRVVFDIANDVPPANPPQTKTVVWLWQLLPEDLETIERERASNPKAPVVFRIEVQGILQRGFLAGNSEAATPVTGEGTFQVAVSEWESLLTALGYGLPPSAAELAGLASVSHPSWAEAEKRLSAARTHLRAGDDHFALIDCLHAFETIKSAPYKDKSWLELVASSMPDQKAGSVAKLLAAHCDYLNRVGHHRGRKPPPDEPDLPEMPLNHWEAELAVAVSQFLLAYALRLRP
jgi:hypothetical protein